tara:strand:- start:324 stop:713 length:390 start_codon:yes stop_codon:yes gene_type:complete
MASGISVKVPFLRDKMDGHGMNKTYKQVAVQNLKMLILTSPGERIMDPLFGVGLRDYLFEQDSPVAHGNISARIRSQVNKYLPYIFIKEVEFDSQGAGNPDAPDNHLQVRIHFRITPLEADETLDLFVD